MRSQVYFLLQQWITFAQAAPLSLSLANARIWAIEYTFAMAAVRNRFDKLELELWAATLS